ncbi:MAG: apolipoprotein N-acyltransferase [Melioribacteraceae bacterium]|nr:apolipoprotein N-acyltransferase [Melioribacteraceae bacterium]
MIWFAFVPLLLALPEKKIKESIFCISIFTLSFGIISYFWIPATFQKFTDDFSFISILALSSFILGNLLLFIIWIAAFNYLKIKDNKSPIKKAVLNTILISVLYFVSEFINIISFKGIPWNKVSLRIALSSNVYFIQTASVIGSLGLSIIVISFNYLIAEFIKTKNKIILLIGIGVFVINLLFGFIMVNRTDESNNKKNVALVSGNVKAETKWTEHGDAIISKMLSLIKELKKHNPELIIWPETALPWSYIENDDILLAIAEILKGHHTQNLIGYLTQSEKDSNLVYNSAYLIDNNGKAIDRYDKRILLDFIEKPFLSEDYNKLLNMSVPSGYDNILRGRRNNLLKTKIGKCKVDICNESLIPGYFNSNDNSFEFIVNISNDAWFEENQNIEHHFYLARLKAIEYRKYMIINSNRGISGIFDEKGRILISNTSDSPKKLVSYIIPNSQQTLYSQFPLLIPALSMVICGLFTIRKIRYIRR